MEAAAFKKGMKSGCEPPLAFGENVNQSRTRGPQTQAVYYRDRQGDQPVKDYIEQLSNPADKVQIDFRISLLNGLPPEAPPPEYPVTSQVEGELRELRCQKGYRILYRRSWNLCVLLHAVQKKAGKISDRDKGIAEKRWEDFKQRMEASPRTPPRAAGSDAP